MALYDDLHAELTELISERWTERQGLVVPDEGSVTFGHDAVRIRAAVLYADLAESTDLVNKYRPIFCATAFKAFLIGSVRIIKFFDGEITAYDGDRVMAVFVGERMCTRAVRSALAINSVMTHIVNPALSRGFTGLAGGFYLGHGAGVDVSDLFVIKTGIRLNADLAWIGRAANIAAKLSSVREPGYRTYITDDVFRVLAEDAKHYEGRLMWEARTWKGYSVHRSSWWMGPHA